MAHRKFWIPNVVVAYWGGSAGGFGKWWVDWDDGVTYLAALGFDAVEYNHVTGSKDTLQNVLQTDAKRQILDGLYVWGYGYAPFPSAGLVSASNDQLLIYAKAGLPYRLALGLVFACDSNSGKSDLSSGTGGSIWQGYSGRLVPVNNPDQYAVDNFIHSGDQDTKQIGP